MRILYLDLDTLRPDHLGCYGYHRNTSRNIDSVAAEGVRFENCYCSDAPCLPSRAALMTGRFGIHTGVVGHGGTAADMRIEGSPRGFRDKLAYNSLPGTLRAAGFRTVSISPFAFRHSAWWFCAGFSEMHDTGKGGAESAEEVTPTALDWVRRNARAENWFLQVNYWDPHTPYRAPGDFGNPFEKDPLPQWLTPEKLARDRELVGPHGAQELNMYDNATHDRYPRQPGELKDMDDLRRLVDGYDCGIRYMDGDIGQLFSALREAGVFDELAILISSDHGENMGELGLYAEHATADQGTCRIPMVIRWPGCRKGYVDAGLHYQLDLGPTLCELLGRPQRTSWDGQSFANSLAEGRGTGRPYLVLSQCAHTCQRSVRFGDWLYLRTYHDFYHLFPREMVFDLKEDPYEERDLAEGRPDLCKEGAHRLLEWHDQMMASMPHCVDPLWTVMKEGGPYHSRGWLKKYCAYLERTGRAWAIAELRQRHPEEKWD